MILSKIIKKTSVFLSRFEVKCCSQSVGNDMCMFLAKSQEGVDTHLV